MKIIEIDGKPVGYEEGDTCNRLVTPEDGSKQYQCDGKMHYPEVENCSCHLSPPCWECTHNPLTCDDCGEEVPLED